MAEKNGGDDPEVAAEKQADAECPQMNAKTNREATDHQLTLVLAVHSRSACGVSPLGSRLWHRYAHPVFEEVVQRLLQHLFVSLVVVARRIALHPIGVPNVAVENRG